MNFVYISFIPGGAGNFFSRSLNLLENFYCFADTKIRKPPLSLEDKINLLSYKDVINKNFDQRNWLSWEVLMCHYSQCREYVDLPDNAYGIWLKHGRHWHGSRPGKQDNIYKFCMDSSEVMEWTLLNCLYKNTYIDVKWLLEFKTNMADDEVHKINLKNIIESQSGFLNEFYQVCSVLGHTISDKELDAVKNLYNDWKQTILAPENFSQFRQHIGLWL